MRSRRQWLILLTVAAVLGTPTVTMADLVSLLLTPPNAVNDVLQDRSWRIELTNAGPQGSVGNVMYGLAAFDQLTVNGHTITLDRSAWMVFTVTRGSSTSRTFQSALAPVTLSGYDFVATSYSGYTLADLLGTSLPANSMIALMELTVPYSTTTYLRQLTDDQYATKQLLDNAVSELKSKGQLIAAFGTSDAQDFYFMSEFNASGGAAEFFGLSPVAYGTAVSPAYFRPLYQEGDQRVDLSQFEFSLRDFMNVTLKALGAESGVAAYYTDRGTVLVNVVPEPASWLSLLAFGGVAFAFRSLKKRKSRNAPAI